MLGSRYPVRMTPPPDPSARLAAMMLIQSFAYGSWIVPLSRFLGAAPEAGGMGIGPPQVGHVYRAVAVASSRRPDGRARAVLGAV